MKTLSACECSRKNHTMNFQSLFSHPLSDLFFSLKMKTNPAALYEFNQIFVHKWKLACIIDIQLNSDFLSCLLQNFTSGSLSKTIKAPAFSPLKSGLQDFEFVFMIDNKLSKNCLLKYVSLFAGFDTI